VAVDFGIMGSLGEEDKRYLALNFLAFFNRDYRAVADAHLRAGWVPADTPVGEFEAAIRAVCEPIFARPIKEISFGRLLLQLFQTARQFNMEIQPQLVLLQKTLFNIEGLGRRLYPDLDLWVTAKPYLEEWARENMGPRAFLRAFKEEAPKWWGLLPHLPGMLHDTLRRAHDGQLTLQWKSTELARLSEQLRENERRNYLAFLGGGLLVGAVVLSALNNYVESWRSIPVSASIAALVAGVWLLWRARPRSDLTNGSARTKE